MRTTQSDDEVVTDADLADAVREGNHEAFSELYRRHRDAAYRFARALLGSEQGADDLVAESFAKVFQRLTAGGGPESAFRSYVMTTLRTTLYKQITADRLVDRRADLPESASTGQPDPVLAKFESSVTLRAFNSLPQRWQFVLACLEIEGMTTANVAELLGIQPNAVSALAFRAREALRVAYLQMHVNTTVVGECAETVGHVASWLCGRLNRATRSRVQRHIDHCARCVAVVDEIVDLLHQMRRSSRPTRPQPPVGSSVNDMTQSWSATESVEPDDLCPAPRLPTFFTVRT